MLAWVGEKEDGSFKVDDLLDIVREDLNLDFALSIACCENVNGPKIEGNKAQAIISLARISIPAAYENAAANDIFLLATSLPFDTLSVNILSFLQTLISSGHHSSAVTPNLALSINTPIGLPATASTLTSIVLGPADGNSIV